MTPSIPQDPSRSARGNAVLIHLECEAVIEPAFANHPGFDHLVPAIQHLASLRTPRPNEPVPHLSTEPAKYLILADLLQVAQDRTLRQAHPGEDPQAAALRQTVHQTLARAQARARRIHDLSPTGALSRPLSPSPLDSAK